ncbi:glycosyltransferase family 4 protein [Candidatus Woesearchaeota archaeon]|nr:glycosyltransferase family 4 protein [Candidatus Woesearchaeota archaeon]
MKICLYPYTEGSGIGTYIIELAHALKETNNEIIVIGEAKDVAEKNMLCFYPSPAKTFSFLGDKIKQLPPFSSIDPFFVGKEVSALINRIDPDIVHTADHLPYHTIRAPVIGVAWDFPKGVKECMVLARRYAPFFQLPYRIVREIEMSIKDYFALQKVRCVLGVTNFVTETLVKKGYRALYFPPGITIPKGRVKKKEELTMTFVGRHHIWTKRKGLYLLFNALENVKQNFTLEIMGEIPPYFAVVLNKYPTLKPKIKLLGLLPREETLFHIAQSHLLVAPSLYDEFGYAILEAEAAGTPALVSRDNTAFRERVHHQKLAIDVFDKHEFARTLQDLLSNKQQLITLGEEAREFIKHEYAWDKKIPQLLKIYDDNKLIR